MQTTFTEGRHAAEFVLSEANGHRSRDNLLLAASQTIIAGMILMSGVIAAGVTNSVAAGAGNTGNGAFTIDGTTPILAGAQNGDYKIVCIEPNTNAGTFEVYDPKGKSLGRYIVGGAAFAKEIKFAIADGSTDFVAGDEFTVTVGVEDADLNYSAMPNTGVSDNQKLAIALYNVATAGGETTTKTAAITRSAEVAGPRIVWPASTSDATKAAVTAALAKQGIIVR